MLNQKTIAAISFVFTSCFIGYKLYSMYIKDSPVEKPEIRIIEDEHRLIPNHIMFESLALKNALTYYVRSCEGGRYTELLGVAKLEKPDKNLELKGVITDFLKAPTQDISKLYLTVDDKSSAQFMQIVQNKDVYTAASFDLKEVDEYLLPYSSKTDIEQSLHINLDSYFCGPERLFGGKDRFNTFTEFFEHALKSTNLYLKYDFDVVMDSNNKPTIYKLKYPEKERYQRLSMALSHSMPLVTDMYFQNSIEGKPKDQRYRYVYRISDSTIILEITNINKEISATVQLL